MEDEEEEETELLDTSTDDKLSALLRRKLELETIQNELKHLRDQQQLLSQMEEVLYFFTYIQPENICS